jgi:pimeloyl-ACP methyl ester carboxylesterase
MPPTGGFFIGCLMKLFLKGSLLRFRDDDGEEFDFHADEASAISGFLGDEPVTVLVHGYAFDPLAPGEDNPFLTVFPEWCRALGQRKYLEFGWYSVPSSPGAVLSAWSRGHWTTYRYAWSLADRAGEVLAAVLEGLTGSSAIVGHSLGSRVALRAARDCSSFGLKKVLLWNGAEYVRTARETSFSCPDIEFLNVVSPDDRVLERLGDVFAPGSGRCVGNDGLGADRPDNWRDMEIDDFLGRAPLNSRSEEAIFRRDHWNSFRHPGFWPEYRKFLGIS